jgi:hypothetical protein
VNCGVNFLLRSNGAHIKAQHKELRLRVALEACENVRRDGEVRAANKWRGGGRENHPALRLSVVLK